MITLNHLTAFCAEATGREAKRFELVGSTNGVDWRVGPPDDQKTCPDCFRAIYPGMTVYRPDRGSLYSRRPDPALYVCAACFPWDRVVVAQHVTVPDNRRPSYQRGMNEKGLISRLDKITPTKAPRFRVECAIPVELHDAKTPPIVKAVARAARRLAPLKAA